SRLSRNLQDILAEQSCICYFVQFLETKDALALVKFWLDVESFKAAASADNARFDGRNGTGKLEEKRPVEDDHKQILKVCDLTMRQSLTDDEKTQICESNKLKLEEPPSVAKVDEGFNSLINSDAVRIYRKYLVSNSPCYIEVPATILSRISLALCGGTCSERIFDDAQQYLLEVMEKSYLNAFLESSFYSKYTFEVLSSDSLTLKDILCSEMALFYFMEYLEQKGKRHILEFCVTASHFRRSTENSQAQADAVVLYEKYFSLQATCPLNVSDKIRFLVEEGICSPDAGTIKNCFEMPSRIIERFLEKRYFQGFLKSQLYKQYLSELLGKIKATGETTGSSLGIQIFFTDRNRSSNNPKRGHRKTFSDVTTSQFVSSQNTLLAMSDTGFHRKRTNTVGTATGTDIMQIDSRQLYNPDLLWRRNSVAGLTFGRVDALGRYERDFDIVEPPQDDDRWSKNRLKKAMRKLVNLPEDKAQEELAWQVAEMIVKDITSVTMSGSEGGIAHHT
ncbi:AAEL007843-PA, partial [Aedes aegypti]